jgi:hypothetical protein
MFKKCSLPGQLPVLQIFLSSEFPIHTLPFPDGAGLLHCLVLTLFPPSHVAEQDDHVDHTDQCPFTAVNKIMINVPTKNSVS